mmetsp:Transcript_4165/g.10542  ORF Transcript_4165/g.10542 Transcript_4165/m.10542 type:complete len:275 (-) Transcript_4165:14-838(-)
MTKCRPSKVPADSTTQLRRLLGTKRDDMYARVVGSLSWLRMTRPDMAYAIKELGRHYLANDKTHWAAAMKAIRYLRGTIDKGLILRGMARKEDLVLRVYVDSSFASCKDTAFGTTGIIVTLGTSTIFASSTTQKVVALSSCEAELVGLLAGALEGTYIRSVLEDLAIIPRNQPLEIYNDSQSAKQLLDRDSVSKRSRHVSIRWHKLKQLLKKENVIIMYEPTDTLCADMLTKGLGPHKHIPHAKRVLEGTVSPSGVAHLTRSRHEPQAMPPLRC